MGRTVPTFRQLIDDAIARWAKFRRALRREDQEYFDRLFRRVRTYTQAATNGNLPDAFTYTVADNFGATSTGTVDVTILANSQPINITGITRLPNGTVQLNFSGIPDYSYLIEATADLTPPAVWTTLSTNMSDTNGMFQYIDAAATNFTTRYYRTAQP